MRFTRQSPSGCTPIRCGFIHDGGYVQSGLAPFVRGGVLPHENPELVAMTPGSPWHSPLAGVADATFWRSPLSFLSARPCGTPLGDALLMEAPPWRLRMRKSLERTLGKAKRMYGSKCSTYTLEPAARCFPMGSLFLLRGLALPRGPPVAAVRPLGAYQGGRRVCRSQGFLGCFHSRNRQVWNVVCPARPKCVLSFYH